MRYRVLKEIVTPLHRYMDGAEFEASDAEPGLDLERLVQHGRLAPVLPAAPAEAAAEVPAEAPAEDGDDPE